MNTMGMTNLKNLPFCIFKASNVACKLENEKNGTVNYTVENTLLLRIWKRVFLLSVTINKP